MHENPRVFALALLPFVMIETAFCVVHSLSFGTGSSQRSLKSQLLSASDGSRANVLKNINV
jgi:hypothetical protein